jgi:hypothetical protein
MRQPFGSLARACRGLSDRSGAAPNSRRPARADRAARQIRSATRPAHNPGSGGRGCAMDTTDGGRW